MQTKWKITKVVANFEIQDNEITDFYLTKCFEDGKEVTENYVTVRLMMEAWCYFMLLGYTCTTNVEKNCYGE